jgi:hypothetical protein
MSCLEAPVRRRNWPTRKQTKGNTRIRKGKIIALMGSLESMNNKINQIENEYTKSLSDIKAKLVRLQGSKSSFSEKEILKIKN